MIILGFTGGLIFNSIDRIYRKYFAGGFVVGGIAAFLLGAELFVNYSASGAAIGVILFGYSISVTKKITHKLSFTILNIILLTLFLYTFSSDYFEQIKLRPYNSALINTTLGKIKVEHSDNDKDGLRIYDHRNNLINFSDNYFSNNNLIFPALLQRNAKDLNVLYIGYSPSMMPLGIYNSPLVSNLDVLYWGGLAPANSNQYHKFPGAALLEKSFADKEKKYDIIFIENIPNDDYISQRILLRYAKKALKDGSGVVVYPEYLMRTYDGKYIKPFQENNLVFLANSNTEVRREQLKDRYMNLLNLDRNENREVYDMLDEVIPEDFVTPEQQSRKELHGKSTIVLPFSGSVAVIILSGLLVFYLLFRVLASRHNDNQYLFFGFENGYSVIVSSVVVIFMLSEYRLVYWFFAPALITLLGVLTINYRSKIFEAFCTLSMGWVLAYLLIPSFILSLQPFIFLFPFWVFSLMSEGNTIKNIHIRSNFKNPTLPHYYTILGILVGLILLIFAKDNKIYSYLIYLAALFRLMYCLKI